MALPSTISMIAFAPLWGRWVAAKGPKPLMLTGFAVMGLGALGLLLFHATILELIVFTVPTMVGNVAVLIAMSNIIVLSVSPKELGIQTGMNQTFRNLGSAVGPVLAATMTATFTTVTVVAVTPRGPITTNVPSITGFLVLFGITAGAALVGFLLSLGVRNFRFHADGSRSGSSAGPDLPANSSSSRGPLDPRP